MHDFNVFFKIISSIGSFATGLTLLFLIYDHIPSYSIKISMVIKRNFKNKRKYDIMTIRNTGNRTLNIIDMGITTKYPIGSSNSITSDDKIKNSKNIPFKINPSEVITLEFEHSELFDYHRQVFAIKDSENRIYYQGKFFKFHK